MSESCIFCKIVRGEIPVERTLETEHAIVFPDASPATPIHHLVIPKQHIASLDAMTEEDRAVMGDVLYAARQAARQLGVSENGYRLVANTNRDAGQEVYHVHFHLMAGRGFRWPPG
jgi:histidine triad (HIT) family protein